VDALPVALEVVQAGEAALARRVRAHVRLGPERVVRLDVRLKRMSAQFNSRGENMRQSKLTFRLKARAKPRPQRLHLWRFLGSSGVLPGT
jgi:hypothetical protein